MVYQGARISNYAFKKFQGIKRVRSDVSEKTYEYLINTCHGI